jgi:uncharacterized protein
LNDPKMARMKLDQNVSNCIKQCIVAVFDPIKIVIFGSYAVGNATPNSDLDIMVIVDDGTASDREATARGRLAIRKALQGIELDMAFDLLVAKQTFFDTAKSMTGTIHFAADQEGVVLYGR